MKNAPYNRSTGHVVLRHVRTLVIRAWLPNVWLPVRLYACISWAVTGRICMKYWRLLRKSVEKILIFVKSNKDIGYCYMKT